MQTSRRRHPNGPQDTLTMEELFEQLEAFLNGQRDECLEDIKIAGSPIKKAKLEGQLVCCKIIKSWVKDARKQYREAQ